MVTIVLPPRPGRAVAQGGLTPLAVHVIEPDGPSPRAVVGLSHTRPDLSTAQLPASHGAISQVPVVITHCPPASSIPHFQPASTPVGPISQTNPEWACWWKAPGQEGSGGVSLPLHHPSTHLVPQRCSHWGKGSGHCQALESLLLGSQRALWRPEGFASWWPQRSFLGGLGWSGWPQS